LIGDWLVIGDLEIGGLLDDWVAINPRNRQSAINNESKISNQ
jgi:hypothetical protein